LKLYLNKPSPYARLVMVVAHEKGLADRLELEWVDPWQNPAALVEANPFSRVPALVTDDGTVLIDSACICDYLDHLGPGRRLVPGSMQARSRTLRKYGLARTLTDSSFGVVIERRFNPAAGEPALAARWLSAALLALEAIEKDPSMTASVEAPDLGDLALAVALGYIEFRLGELAWRNGRPRLAGWYSGMSARGSMQATPHA
jgi:glutathione S-transferase